MSRVRVRRHEVVMLAAEQNAVRRFKKSCRPLTARDEFVNIKRSTMRDLRERDERAALADLVACVNLGDDFRAALLLRKPLCARLRNRRTTPTGRAFHRLDGFPTFRCRPFEMQPTHATEGPRWLIRGRTTRTLRAVLQPLRLLHGTAIGSISMQRFCSPVHDASRPAARSSSTILHGADGSDAKSSVSKP